MPKKYLLLSAAVIIAAAIYCYNPFALYFQNDDFIHIPLSRDGVLLQRNSFRPVCDLSIMLDYWLWGKNAVGYHFTNLFLHIICTMLVFFLGKDLCKKYSLLNNFPFAFVAALIFFIYPMHSEAVFWILGRSAILGCIFFLLSCIFFLKRQTGIFFLLSILSALAAWLSYESAWILPIILFIISFVDIRINYSTSKRELLFIALVIIFFLLYIIGRNYFIHEVVGNYEAESFLNFNIPVLATNFLKLMMRSWLPSFDNPRLGVAIFIVVAMLVGFIFFLVKKKTSALFFPLLIFLWLLALAPCASLGVDTRGTEGERFLYLPSIFICFLLSYLLFYCFTGRTMQKMIIVLLVVFYMGVLAVNAKNYRFAGDIARTTINEINNLSGFRFLYMIDLPQAQRGALIFRAGFPEAVQWLQTPGTADSIVICSRRNENFPLQDPYHTTLSRTVVANCNGASLPGETGEAVFIFTDSLLIISK